MSLLTDTRSKIEESVPKQYKRGYESLMAAGLKMMFSDKTFPLMKQYVQAIKSPADIPRHIAHGIVKLFSILYNGRKGKIPLEASGAALLGLMTHALEYIERMAKIPITEEIIAETTRLVIQGYTLMVKQASGLRDDQFQQVMSGRGRELINQPPAGPLNAAAETAPSAGGM